MSDVLTTLYGPTESIDRGAPTSTIPTRAVDVVAVLNSETFEQVFADGRPLEAEVIEAAELMEHPLETGATIVDHKIIRPIEIVFPLRVAGDAYKDVYAEIRQLFIDGTLLIVQTRTHSYDSMLIEAMPHREQGESIDSIEIGLRFKEARFVTPSFGTLPPRKVENKAQASTKKKGTQKTTRTNTPTTAKAVATAKAAKPKQSTLYGLFGG